MLMKLLFVEDDQAIAMGLVYTLKKEGYEVVWCDHKRSALQQLDQQTFDLLLLDVGLPDGSGYDICTYAKSRQDVPVLFLTALDDEGNVVMGLDMGGDDYITKPFSPRELVFRIKAQLRRQQYQTSFPLQEETCLTAGLLSVDKESCRVYKEGREIGLTGREYLLLTYFMENADKIISKERLYEQVWGEYSSICDNTIMVHIRHLREKIEDTPSHPRQLITVKGLGYKLKKRID